MLQEDRLDAERLAATLNHFGIPYLRTATPAEPLPLDERGLVAALAQHPSPRLHEALIPLFLSRPELGDDVPAIADKLSPEAASRLRHMYTAAVYLQHLWRTQLEIYLGPAKPFSDHFGQSLWHLPPPSEHHGEAGLRVLAEHFQAETGANWLSAYESTMSLYLTILRLRAHG